MRLIERDKRTIYLRPRLGGEKNEYNETVPGTQWGPPVMIRAACQPAGGSLDAQIYGERVKSMITLFYAGPERIQPGDGLCVHVDSTVFPDYRVVSVQDWGHRRIDAELIPPERRRG